VTALFLVALGVCPLAAAARKTEKPKPAPPPTVLPAEPAWTLTLDGPPVAGGAMDAARIYIPIQTDDGDEIVALERQTGMTVWEQDVKADWPVLVSNGVVYAAGSNEIHALDAATGEPRWAASLERAAGGPLHEQDGLVVALMIPDDVLAFRVTDGHQVWRHSLGGTAGLRQMTLGAGAAYVTAPGGHVIALSLHDGHPLWDVTIPGVPSAPAAAKDRVFVGSSDNFFYAFDADSGRLEWKWRSGGDVVGADADKDTVYFASLDNIVRAVNRGNGNQRWQKDTGTRPVAPPRVIGPVVVVPGVSAISAFSVLTGAPVGSFAPPGSAELKGEPMLDPGLRPFEVAAAILTRDGRLIALRPTGMMFREAPAAPFTQLPGRRLDKEPPPFAPTEQ